MPKSYSAVKARARQALTRKMSAEFTVLGAGAWGTALASVLADGGSAVTLFGRDNQQIEDLKATRINRKYLPGIQLPEGINYTHDWQSIGETLGIGLVAVPYQQARKLLRDMATFGINFRGIVWASKGIEQNTYALAHEIVADELGETLPFAMLSGPNFAKEVARKLPAAVTVGGRDEHFVDEMCRHFHTQYFRPYSNDDLIGVEVGGAIKNVIAIAAGIVDGLDLGANARAALVTRGLAEIARWGIARGGRPETFMGLSGLGDLVLTCTDDLSRNRRFGLCVASGKSLEQAIEEVGLVEGAKTSVALAQGARRDGIDMPICTQVAAVVANEISPKEAVLALLARDVGAEIS